MRKRSSKSVAYFGCRRYSPISADPAAPQLFHRQELAFVYPSLTDMSMAKNAFKYVPEHWLVSDEDPVMFIVTESMLRDFARDNYEMELTDEDIREIEESAVPNSGLFHHATLDFMNEMVEVIKAYRKGEDYE